MKLCRDCQTEKPYEAFSLRNGRPVSYCKACSVLRAAAWKKANPQRHKANQARHRDNKREKRRADSLARYHRLMAENPEAIRAARREWARTPKGALYNRLAAHGRRGVKYDAEAREYVAIILNDPCVYCGAAASEVDHITPVSRGGDGQWSNLAPACRTCNAAKCDRSLLSMIGA